MEPQLSRIPGKKRRKIGIEKKKKFTVHHSHVYPLKLKHELDPAPVIKNMRLCGMFLKVKHVPEIEANIHVFTYAMYVNLEQARKYLKKWKNGVPSKSNDPKG